MKIVFFKGNPNYGEIANEKMTSDIVNIIKKFTYDYEVLESATTDLVIPKADVYIGFSRGTRYLGRCDNIKISIAGITGKGITLIKNKDDNVKNGDFSEISLGSHFHLTDSMRKQIENTLKEQKRGNEEM